MNQRCKTTTYTMSDNNQPSIFRCLKANEVMEEAAKTPPARPLYDCLWYEGEVSCLFSDSNLGKSILAMEIAESIASQGIPVYYYDFELSFKQFEARYSNPATGAKHDFPDCLYHLDPQPALPVDRDIDFMTELERDIIEKGMRTLIVDNITWLCAASEKGEDAAKLMSRLMSLKKKQEQLSILVIAHTPKRDAGRPLTPNDLAGSRKLFNFFDSAFAIGKSARDNNLRYIKQIKCRASEFTYDENNVITCSIVKENDGFLHFLRQGFAKEIEHLRTPFDDDNASIQEQCNNLHNNGMTYRDIASQLNISLAKVQRELKKQYKPQEQPPTKAKSN